MLSARAAAGVHRATMSALIAIFVFVIFQFLAASRPAFQAPPWSAKKSISYNEYAPPQVIVWTKSDRIGEPDDQTL